MPLPHMFLALLVAAAWGGNFVAARIAVAQFPPFMLMGLRFALVAIMLLPVVQTPYGKLRDLALLAFVLGVLHFALLFAGIATGIDIATATITGQMGMPFSCLLGALLLSDHMGKWRLLGMAIAFGGIVVIAGTPQVSTYPDGFFIILVAAFFWGYANILMKRLGHMGIFALLAWMSLLAVPQLILLSLFFEKNQWQSLVTATPLSLVSLFYTATISTIVAYGAWYFLLRHYKVTQVAPFSLFVPVFGIIFARLFLGGAIDVHTIIGGAITLLGVAIIVLRRPRLAELGR